MSNDGQNQKGKQKLNSPSLMDGYQSVLNQKVDTNQEEYSEEISQGLMSTYNQMLDAYRQGTIDGKKKDEDK